MEIRIEWAGTDLQHLPPEERNDLYECLKNHNEFDPGLLNPAIILDRMSKGQVSLYIVRAGGRI